MCARRMYYAWATTSMMGAPQLVWRPPGSPSGTTQMGHERSLQVVPPGLVLGKLSSRITPLVCEQSMDGGIPTANPAIEVAAALAVDIPDRTRVQSASRSQRSHNKAAMREQARIERRNHCDMRFPADVSRNLTRRRQASEIELDATLHSMVLEWVGILEPSPCLLSPASG